MSSTFRHIDSARFMGSWPVLQDTATILPRTLHTSARILGTVRETSGGYDVDGRSFNVIVDGEPVFSVTFSNPMALTLDEVITQINTDSQAAISQDIAFRDNGFLLLKSPTTGTVSYLRIYTDPASTPTDVFEKLGLFSETESWGGDIASAAHADPDRQVAMPDQMSVMEGEPLTARVVNRALMQLSVQNDMVYNLTHRRRLARVTKVEVSPYATSTPEGYQFSGGTMVYVGPVGGDLDKYFQILGTDGKEFTKEEVTELENRPGTLTSVEVAERTSETGATVPVYECRATCTSFDIFASTDPDDNHYLVLDTGVAALDNVPLKIVRYLGLREVTYAPINPATGEDLTDDVVTAVGASRASDLIKQSVALVPCQVTAVTDSAGGSNVIGVTTDRLTGIVPTKVELGNRIIFLGEDVITAGVAIGDELVWSGHSPSSGVQDNNGTYRVSAIIDKETVEVVGGTWEPVVLTSDLFTAGTVTIQVDGVYVEDPFIEFVASPAGAIPEDLVDDIVIQYYGMKTLKEAWDDDDTLISGDLERQHESSDIIERAILNIIGPSTNNIEDYVRQAASYNLETQELRMDREHHRMGKHKSINADTLFAYQNVVADEYLNQRGPTNWDAKVATFFYKGNYATDEAAVSVVTQHNGGGVGEDYLGGVKVRVDGGAGDQNLWGYLSDLTVEANTATASRWALGYRSRVYFDSGNITNLAHFYGTIPSWTSSTLDNEYGVYLTAMSRGTTQSGLNVSSMNSSAGDVYLVRAGTLTAGGSAFGVSTSGISGTGSAYAVRTGHVQASSGGALGLSVNGVTGTTNAYGVSLNVITGGTGTARALNSNGVATTTGDARAIHIGPVSVATLGDAYALNVTSVASTTSGAAYGSNIGSVVTASGAARGHQLGPVTGTSTAYGFRVGTVTASDAQGVVVSEIDGTNFGYGFTVGVIDASSGEAGAVRAAGISAAAAAFGVQTGTIGGATAYGLDVGAMTASTGVAYGVNVTSITGVGATGVFTGAIAGGTSTAYGVDITSLTGVEAAGIHTGAIDGGTSNGYGADFGDISGFAAYGARTGTITSTGGYAYGVYCGALTGATAARGFRVASLTATTSSAYLLQCGDISGAGTAIVYVSDVTGTGNVRGLRTGVVSGTDAVGAYFTGAITGTTGNAHAVQVGGGITTSTGTGNAAVIRADGNVSSFGGQAHGLYVNNGIIGAAGAAAVLTGGVTSTAGSCFGLSVNGMTAGVATYGLSVSNLAAGTGTARVINANTVASDTGGVRAFKTGPLTANTSGDVAGVDIGAISTPSGTARGVDFFSVTGSSTAIAFQCGSVTASSATGFDVGDITGTTFALGLDAGTILATGGTAYGIRLGTMRSQGATSDAYGLFLSDVRSDNENAYSVYVTKPTAGGTAYALYTADGAGDVYHRLGGDVDPTTDGVYDLGDETDPLRWRYIRASKGLLVGDATSPTQNRGVRISDTYTDNAFHQGIRIDIDATNDNAINMDGIWIVASSNNNGVTPHNRVRGLQATARVEGDAACVTARGIHTSVDLDNNAGTVTYATGIYVAPGNRARYPTYDVGVWCVAHTVGVDASASYYSQGGANIFSSGSLSVSKDTDLLSSTYYPRLSANHTLNLIGNTTAPSFNFDNVAATQTSYGSSWYMELGSDLTLRFYRARRDGVGSPVDHFNMISGESTFNSKLTVNRTNGTLTTNFVTETGNSGDNVMNSTQVLFSTAGARAETTLLKVHLAPKTGVASDGTIDTYAVGVHNQIDVPNYDSSSTTIGYDFIQGSSSSAMTGIQQYGTSIGYRAVLQMHGDDPTARGSAYGFYSWIHNNTKFASKSAYYARTMTTDYATYQSAFDSQSVWTRVANSTTFAFRCGGMTGGASGDGKNNAHLYGAYFGLIKSWSASGSNIARGIHLENIVVDTPGTGSITTGVHLGAASGYNVYGVNLNNVAAVNNSYGINIDTVTATSNNAYGVRMLDISGADLGYGVTVTDVDGPDGAYGYHVNDIDSTGGAAYGMYINAVDGRGAYGLRVGDIDSTNSTYSAYGILVTNIGNTTTGNNTYGVRIEGIESPSGYSAVGLWVDQPTGAGVTWAIYSPGDCYFGDSTGDILMSQAALKDVSTAGSTQGLWVVETKGAGSHDVGTFGIVPSIRDRKTNIRDMGDTDWVYALRPVRFNYKGGGGEERYGLIAEEVEEVEPTLVTYMEDEKEIGEGYNPEPGEEIITRGETAFAVTRKLSSVAYHSLIPVLLNEVQKLNKRLAKLEKKAA